MKQPNKANWTNLDGYKLVLDRANALHKKRTGLDKGGAVWLAKELGITRQALHNHGKYNGFPQVHVESIEKLTGLAPNVIRPHRKSDGGVLPESFYIAVKRLAMKRGLTVYELLRKAGWFLEKKETKK